MSLPWDKQAVTESTEVHEVAEKFIGANEFKPQCQVSEFLNAYSTVQKGAAINIHTTRKRLNLTVYKSRCERRTYANHQRRPTKRICDIGANIQGANP